MKEDENMKITTSRKIKHEYILKRFLSIEKNNNEFCF